MTTHGENRTPSRDVLRVQLGNRKIVPISAGRRAELEAAMLERAPKPYRFPRLARWVNWNIWELGQKVFGPARWQDEPESVRKDRWGDYAFLYYLRVRPEQISAATKVITRVKNSLVECSVIARHLIQDGEMVGTVVVATSPRGEEECLVVLSRYDIAEFAELLPDYVNGAREW